MASKYINILQSHEPLMDAGDYIITVKQRLKVTSKSVDETFAEMLQKFAVQGERFVLEPGSVFSVYPPAGSLGEHTNTFPHIILNRSTLPWERSVDGGTEGIWLALLLFDAEENPDPKTVTLQSFKDALGFKNIEDSSGDDDNGPFNQSGDGPGDQPITIIEVKRSLLEQIMPKRADLNFTAHSRREVDSVPAKGGDGKWQTVTTVDGRPERAVLIGNRLPKAGSLSTVHLVSLESRFADGGEFDYGTAGPDDLIQLVTLKSWSFASVDPKFSLFGMLEHLNRVPSVLSRPYLNDQTINLDLSANTIIDNSEYHFPVTTTGTSKEADGSRKFDGASFLHLEIADTNIDADDLPQLDPFPQPLAFSIAVEIKVKKSENTGIHAVMGHEESGIYKPSVLYDPDNDGIIYMVTGEDGVQYSHSVPGILPDDTYTRLVWTKEGRGFCFYKDGSLVHTDPAAPGRIYTKDSPYLIGKVDDDTPLFVGQIKNLQIFRRVLSAAEIRDIFTGAASTNAPIVNARLEKGMLALPHLTRVGKKAVSWYRGPLSVRTTMTDFTLPATAADELLVLDNASGMFDASYAAAWQLGRLMALEDRQFSLQLYNLKRRNSLESKREAQKSQGRSHLDIGNTSHNDGLADTTAKIKDWLKRRHILDQVPFQYLIPYEDMLPVESIRFFNIDPKWVLCLKDGACSIGRTSSDDLNLDNSTNLAAADDVPAMSGFLMRSALVSGYPGLQILGFSGTVPGNAGEDHASCLPVVRMERLSDEILLCIFEGDIHTLDFFQKPDVLHFGVDSDGTNYSKQLRRADGSNLPPSAEAFTFTDVEFWHDKTLRVANFDKMAVSAATSLKATLITELGKLSEDSSEFDVFTSADFAMEMLEGAEKVRFVRP